MTTTKTARRYFVAINAYRSSTSNGVANTWRVQECHSQAQQRRILAHGLPVRDSAWEDSNGVRHATYTTMGVRAATASEIREAKRDGHIQLTDHHFDGIDE